MAAPASDLRAWIALLEREGELVRVRAEVDPDLEITEIVDRIVKAGGPALLFENAEGLEAPAADQPVRHRAADVPRVRRRAARRRRGEALGDARAAAAAGARRQGRGRSASSSRSQTRCRRRSRGRPARRSCSRATTSTSTRFPIQRCWPLDPAPFITLPAVITQDRATGVRNVGMYRMQKIDRRSTFMHWQIHKDGRADLLAAPDGRIPVAVALGLDPVTAYSASAPLPKHIGELMVAGFLKGSAVELVQCKTVDLEVPANAEIVLEGWVDAADDVGLEGPFGDHTGFYTPPEEFPIFRISAITMRRDAIYPSIVVGKPPAEDEWLAKATERIFLPAIRMSVPEIVDYDLPTAGAFHNCVIVSIRKRFPGHARKVMHAIWGLGLLSLSKSVVVVDEHVDVHDYEQVFFYVCANVDPKRDVVLCGGPDRPARPRRRAAELGGKIGIDATAKGPDEGAREWPPEIEMSADVKAPGRRALGRARDPRARPPGRRAEWRSRGRAAPAIWPVRR